MYNCNMIYQYVTSTDEKGFTAREAAESCGINIMTARSILQKMVRDGRLQRVKSEKRVENRTLVRYYNVSVDLSEYEDKYTDSEIILQLLESGETVDQYWRKDTTEADSDIHERCLRLWKKGYPIMRRKNKETGLIEYYLITK